MNVLLKLNRAKYFIILVPPLVLYSYFYFIPVFTGIYYSLTSWNGISSKATFIGLQNYLTMLKSSTFVDSLGFTFKYTFLLVIATTLIGLALALMLNMKLAGHIVYRGIYFFPTVLSMVTVGVIWKEIYARVLPVIGQLLRIESLSSNILGSLNYAEYGVLFVNIWQQTAIPMVLFIAGLQSIPKDIQDAAIIDGASPLNFFRYIKLPYLMPVFEVSIVLTLKSGISVFDYIKVMTDGGPGGATQSLGILIYDLGFKENKFGYASAQSLVIFIIIIIVSFVQIKVLSKHEVEY